ncbi:MAG: hypothetical protein AAFZ91_11075 [Pseudomonadota bacterium]
MTLVAPVFALFSSIGLGAAFSRLLSVRPRLSGALAFLVLVLGVISGFVLGFPGKTAGQAAFLFGLVFALVSWTVTAPRLTSVLIWALIAAMMLSAALLLLLPINFSALAIWLTFIMPLLWVVIQFWCYWERRTWIIVTGLIVVSIASTLIVLLIPPPV